MAGNNGNVINITDFKSKIQKPKKGDSLLKDCELLTLKFSAQKSITEKINDIFSSKKEFLDELMDLISNNTEVGLITMDADLLCEFTRAYNYLGGLIFDFNNDFDLVSQLKAQEPITMKDPKEKLFKALLCFIIEPSDFLIEGNIKYYLDKIEDKDDYLKAFSSRTGEVLDIYRCFIIGGKIPLNEWLFR